MSNINTKESSKMNTKKDNKPANIDWNDFNYPPIPYLKIVHFSFDEVSGIINKYKKKMINNLFK